MEARLCAAAGLRVRGPALERHHAEDSAWKHRLNLPGRRRDGGARAC